MPRAASLEPVDKAAITALWERTRQDLRGLLASATREQLRQGSDGTRWTNEQLLFHMVFGFLVVRRLLPLVRLVSRLPAPVGRGFARLLDSAHRPFHVVNYLGACGGALVFNRKRMGWLGDRTIESLRRSLERDSEDVLAAGMPFPTTWDPYFTSVMSLVDVYRYPVLHYEHHRAQLTLPRVRR